MTFWQDNFRGRCKYSPLLSPAAYLTSGFQSMEALQASGSSLSQNLLKAACCNRHPWWSLKIRFRKSCYIFAICDCCCTGDIPCPLRSGSRLRTFRTACRNHHTSNHILPFYFSPPACWPGIFPRPSCCHVDYFDASACKRIRVGEAAAIMLDLCTGCPVS